jgi:hypothetical protein
MQGNSYINLVTIFTISAKLPPPLQQFQWLRPTSELGRAKISENKMEVGLAAEQFGTFSTASAGSGNLTFWNKSKHDGMN